MIMDFRTGPFEFSRAPKGATVGGAQTVRWVISYGPQMLAEKHLPASASQSDVRDAFAPAIGRFIAEAKERGAPDLYHLVSHDGAILAVVALNGLSDLTGCIPDDRFPYWIITASRPTRGKPVTLAEFAQVSADHLAKPISWVAELLPNSVLTNDPAEWEAPTSWHIRHVVGEGSFTGVTGAAAAALVGVTPQNFRKYTAADDARTRQPISFAMWHLLLHKLGVQRL